MNDVMKIEEDGVEVVDSQTLVALQSAEIDMQIATARKYPRSIRAFRAAATDLATLDEETAASCMYTLPRAKKQITGPSIRMAEILASQWQHCRYGARIIEEQRDFVVAQGVFHDLQNNNLITIEVKRRIVNKSGRRFDVDMIGVTGNAACSIALRNAILRGIPQPMWSPVYDAAVRTAIGDAKTLTARRTAALSVLEKAGADRQDIFDFLEVADDTEITLEHLAVLTGIKTAVREGDVKIEDAFKVGAVSDSKRTLDMKTGEVKEPDADPLDGDGIPEAFEGKSAPDEEKPAANSEASEKQQSLIEEPIDDFNAFEAILQDCETPNDVDEFTKIARGCSWAGKNKQKITDAAAARKAELGDNQ
ncbi:MAG: hypothetical protein AAFQ84_06095 [Pseudomonadota bacterium]